METLKKYSIYLKSLFPFIMHSDAGCNPFNPLVRQLKEISAIRGKKDDHHLAMSKLEFKLGIYYDESIGIYLPVKCLMGSFKSAARKSKKGPNCRGITIDCALGTPLLGYEGMDPEKLWNIETKTGRKHVFIEPVNVQRAKIMRTRAIFPTWEVKFDLYLDTECFQPDQLKALIETAGFERGLCELRPEKATGTYGRFSLESMKEVK
jgi:hypothetical protein